MVRITHSNGFIEEKPFHEDIEDQAPPVPPAIRRITKRAFMKRFLQSERIAIRNSTDDIVIDIYDKRDKNY